jgi:nucleoside-diphosphate kinase
MEQTLIIFKPDSVQRGIVGEILTRFERAGLKIVGMKMLSPDYDHLHHHYETIGTVISRHGQRVFDDTVAMMQLGPVIAVVLEGIESVALVRKMVGSTEPKSAAPGTIRGDYAHMSYGHADEQPIALVNILHASGDSDEAKREIDHWFSDSELFDYETAHQHLTQRSRRHTKKD